MKTKKKLKKLPMFILIIVILTTAIVFFAYGIKNKIFFDNEDITTKTKEEKIALLKSHYASRVSLTTDADIYEYKDGKYKDVGDISKGYFISLKELEIDENSFYFPIEGSDYYLKYDSVKPQEGINEFMDPGYVLFNENVLVKKGTPLYQNNKEVLRYSAEKQYPILIKEEEYYVVKYRDELFTINKKDTKKIIEANNVDADVASSIPVLNYHFLYKKGDWCNQIICLKYDYFDSHLAYLKENNYFDLTMKDIDLWLDEKIRLPKKSVAVTFDDGTMKTSEYLAPLLEKHEFRGTLFLVTSWFNKSSFESPYIFLESHGHAIHGVGNRDNKSLLLSYEQLDKDFKESIDALDGQHKAFSYPYYEYNATVLKAVKNNFDMGFVGGGRNITQKDDRYLLPRKIVHSHHNLNNFKQLLNQ